MHGGRTAVAAKVWKLMANLEEWPRVALIAHDAKKDDLVAFCVRHGDILANCRLMATGTTGSRIAEACPNLVVQLFKSGPLGGDQQIGAQIAEGHVDALIFFIDPLTPHPHDVDVKALTRLAVLYDVAMALNRATADIIVLRLAKAQRAP